MSFLIGAFLGLALIIFVGMLIAWGFVFLWYIVKFIFTILWYIAGFLVLFALFAALF